MRRVLAGVLAGLLLWPGPAHADRIVTVEPSVASIGEQLRVRTAHTVRRRVKVDFARRGHVVRTGAVRVGTRQVLVTIPDRAASLLGTVAGSPVPTRLRMRLVIRGEPGPWARGAKRPLVGRATAPVPTPTPPAVPTPTPPSVPTKRLLAASDLTYLGAFAMPGQACGWSTAYSTTGLALRRVDGQVHVFSGAHVYSGGLVYEVQVPGLSTQPASWPVATMADEWCDIYDGRKRTGDDPQPLGDANQTVGLLYDNERLYWSFGEFYNGDHSNDNALGYTTLGATPTPHGPWHTSGAVHSQKVRGGTLVIPRWFSDAYLGGRRLGIGFGGYYNIIGDGSMGPALFAVAEPTGDAQVLDPVPLMDHPATVTAADQWAIRPDDYWIDGIDWAVSPIGGVGRWAPGDTVSGAAVWIDEPDVHGLLVASQLQLGRIWYADGGLHSEGDGAYWYFYDPLVLAEVAQGRRSPDSVQPAQIEAVDYPGLGTNGTGDFTTTQRIAGVAYDSPTRTVYFLQLNARPMGLEWTPVVHAFRVG